MHKFWLTPVLSFAVPFLIGGIGAWLWTGNISDNPHAGGGGLLSDKQIEEAEQQMDADANKEFIRTGALSGSAGLGFWGGLILVSRNRRRGRELYAK